MSRRLSKVSEAEMAELNSELSGLFGRFADGDGDGVASARPNESIRGGARERE